MFGRVGFRRRFGRSMADPPPAGGGASDPRSSSQSDSRVSRLLGSVFGRASSTDPTPTVQQLDTTMNPGTAGTRPAPSSDQETRPSFNAEPSQSTVESGAPDASGLISTAVPRHASSCPDPQPQSSEPGRALHPRSATASAMRSVDDTLRTVSAPQSVGPTAAGAAAPNAPVTPAPAGWNPGLPLASLASTAGQGQSSGGAAHPPRASSQHSESVLDACDYADDATDIASNAAAIPPDGAGAGGKRPLDPSVPSRHPHPPSPRTAAALAAAQNFGHPQGFGSSTPAPFNLPPVESESPDVAAAHAFERAQWTRHDELITILRRRLGFVADEAAIFAQTAYACGMEFAAATECVYQTFETMPFYDIRRAVKDAIDTLVANRPSVAGSGLRPGTAADIQVAWAAALQRQSAVADRFVPSPPRPPAPPPSASLYPPLQPSPAPTHPVPPPPSAILNPPPSASQSAPRASPPPMDLIASAFNNPPPAPPPPDLMQQAIAHHNLQVSSASAAASLGALPPQSVAPPQHHNLPPPNPPSSSAPPVAPPAAPPAAPSAPIAPGVPLPPAVAGAALGVVPTATGLPLEWQYEPAWFSHVPSGRHLAAIRRAQRTWHELNGDVFMRAANARDNRAAPITHISIVPDATLLHFVNHSPATLSVANGSGFAMFYGKMQESWGLIYIAGMQERTGQPRLRRRHSACRRQRPL